MIIQTMNIPIEKKRAIYDGLMKADFYNLLVQDDKLLDFIHRVWDDVDRMPSQDNRYNNFIDECHQHCINNDDWDANYLFIERLKVFTDNTDFQKFIETAVSPSIQNSLEYIKKCVLIVNICLKDTPFCLGVYRYGENGCPEYLVEPQQEEKIEKDLPLNDIVIFIEKNPTGHTQRINSHRKPKTTPSFVLVSDKGWNDYGVYSTFDLFYHKNDNEAKFVGTVKILNKSEEKDENGLYYTEKFMRGEYVTFEGDFFSLGQEISYYNNLKEILGVNYLSFLWAMQDCAYFSNVEDLYDSHRCLHSLRRDNQPERFLRLGKSYIEGQSPEERCNFTYVYRPPYSDTPINVVFHFKLDKRFSSRVNVIIGENGTGKTQLIHRMIRDWKHANPENFEPSIPKFSKYMLVSNCCIDIDVKEETSQTFNFRRCGLAELSGTGEKLRDEVKKKLSQNASDIEKKDKVEDTYDILSTFLNKQIIHEIFVEDAETGKSIFDVDKLISTVSYMSSGEINLILSFCEIISEIRYDTLLIFDEPETHLHPNAITALMSALMRLLDKYESYAFIATHSPLIVREVLADSVQIITRDSDEATIRHIGVDSFGANLTLLTEEIFHNKSVEKYYESKLSALVERGRTYEEIIRLIKPSSNIPVNVSTMMFIRNLIELHNNETD